MCWIPWTRYAPATSSGPCEAAISTHGCDGVTSVVDVVPSSHLDAHQDVGDGALQTRELDARAGEAAFARVDRAALEQRIRQLLHGRFGDVAHAVGEPQRDRQAHAGQDRGAPQDVVPAGRRLLDLQGRRPHLVRSDRRRECQQREHRGGEGTRHGGVSVGGAGITS